MHPDRARLQQQAQHSNGHETAHNEREFDRPKDFQPSYSRASSGGYGGGNSYGSGSAGFRGRRDNGGGYRGPSGGEPAGYGGRRTFEEDRNDARSKLMIEAPSDAPLYQKDAFAAPLAEHERGRPRREPNSERENALRSRWGPENERMNITGLPTSLPSDLSNDQIENYIINMRIEELGRKIRIGDYIPEKDETRERSVSPPPTFGLDGKRNNTRDLRYKKKAEDERHMLVEIGMKTVPGFRPPLDYKKPAKLIEKLFIPQMDFPEINFIGLIIGPRGNTLKKMEGETGTKISIRGKGSVKEGKSNLQPGEDEALHAIITGDTEDRVQAAIVLINKIIESATSVPEGQNELKRNQLRELAELNGTLRDDENQTCDNCGNIGHRRFECPEAANFTTSIICRICGGVGHIARDCLQKNDPAALQAANNRNQKLDDEYASLMAELGGGSKPAQAAGGGGPPSNLPPLPGGPAPWHQQGGNEKPWQQPPQPQGGGNWNRPSQVTPNGDFHRYPREGGGGMGGGRGGYQQQNYRQPPPPGGGGGGYQRQSFVQGGGYQQQGGRQMPPPRPQIDFDDVGDEDAEAMFMNPSRSVPLPPQQQPPLPPLPPHQQQYQQYPPLPPGNGNH